MRSRWVHPTTFVLAALVAAYVGCGLQPTIPGPPLKSTLQVLSSPTPFGHAYISDDLNPGNLSSYALPLGSKSVPAAHLTNLLQPYSMALDRSHRLFVTTYAGNAVLVYDTPIASGASPAFSLGLTFSPEMLALDSQGDVFVEGTVSGARANVSPSGASQSPDFCFKHCHPPPCWPNCPTPPPPPPPQQVVSVFVAPISSASTVSFTFIVAHDGNTRGMAFDTSGNLWVNDIGDHSLVEFSPPFGATSAPGLKFANVGDAPFGSVVFDSKDNMYVTDGNGVDVYEPPFSTTTTKAFTVATAGTAQNLAFDRRGDLYVTETESSSAKVLVFSPPFNAASAAHHTYDVAGSNPIPGVAIGP